MSAGSPPTGGPSIPIGSNLTVRRHVTPDGGALQLRGALDATLDGRRMLAGVHTAVVVDLKGVTAFTPGAIPPWLETVQALEALDVALVRVPSLLLGAFNEVEGFAGTSQLLSGEVRYGCAACGARQEVLLDFRVARPGAGPDGWPEVPCQRCKGRARVSNVEDDLRFVVGSPVPVGSATITKLLDLVPEHLAATRVCARQELEERPVVSGLWMSGPLVGDLKLGSILRRAPGPLVASGRGVTGSDGQAISQLVDFLIAQRKAVLAEVTLPLARALARDGRASQRPIASLWLPFDCLTSRAHRFESPVEGEVLEALRSGQELTTACVFCGQPAASSSSRDLAAVLQRLHVQQPAEPYLDFMSEHPDGIDRTAEPEELFDIDVEEPSRALSRRSLPRVPVRASPAVLPFESPVLEARALAVEVEKARPPPPPPPPPPVTPAADEEEVLATADDGPADLIAPMVAEPDPEPTIVRAAPMPAPRPKPAPAAPAATSRITGPATRAPTGAHAPAAPPALAPEDLTDPARALPAFSVERFGNYEVLEPLGTGGMADVVLARQVGPGGFVRKVALKRILPHHARHPDFVEMFLREARVAAQLNHPNVVQIYEFGEQAGRYFMAMEYVRGWDLHGILRQMAELGTPMPLPIACRIGADLCAGLGGAHRHLDEDDRPAPIIHRDVSPHNVLISDRGIVKLADFGIAKDAANDAHTQVNMVKGKTAYIAPERVIGTVDPLDPRPDLFGVGIVLHECLLNLHPFRRDTDLATIKALLHEPVPLLRESRPEASAELEALLARALAKDPAERWSSAEELQEVLEDELRHLRRRVGPAEVGGWLRALHERRAAPPQARPASSMTKTIFAAAGPPDRALGAVSAAPASPARPPSQARPAVAPSARPPSRVDSARSVTRGAAGTTESRGAAEGARRRPEGKDK